MERCVGDDGRMVVAGICLLGDFGCCLQDEKYEFQGIGRWCPLRFVSHYVDHTIWECPMDQSDLLAFGVGTPMGRLDVVSDIHPRQEYSTVLNDIVISDHKSYNRTESSRTKSKQTTATASRKTKTKVELSSREEQSRNNMCATSRAMRYMYIYVYVHFTENENSNDA